MEQELGAAGQLGVIDGAPKLNKAATVRERALGVVSVAVLLAGLAGACTSGVPAVVGVLVLAAAFFKWPLAAVLGLTVGLCQSLGKLSLDALIQKDVGEHVRTSMFARSETLLQLSWVIGGLLGIGLFTLDVSAPLGMVITAVILLAWLSFVMARVINPPPAPAPIRP